MTKVVRDLAQALILSGMRRPSRIAASVEKNLIVALEAAGFGTFRQSMFDHKLDIFDGDEIGREMAHRVARPLVDLIRNHDAVFVIAPEYHGGIAPIVKNWFDWAQAATPTPLLAERRVGLLTIVPERHLGVLGLNQMAALCHALGGTVMPGSMGIQDHPDQVDESGELKDRGAAQRLRQLVQALAGYGGVPG